MTFGDRTFEPVVPTPDPFYEPALAAWCQYYYETESYDRSFPGAWSRFDNDSWMPEPQFISGCLIHARLRRGELLIRLHGIPPQTQKDAQMRAQWLKFEQQREVYLGRKD